MVVVAAVLVASVVLPVTPPAPPTPNKVKNQPIWGDATGEGRVASFKKHGKFKKAR